MIQLFHRMISAALGISEKQIGHTLDLLEDGATIPFISRYRKEATGGLDEVQIEQIKEQHDKLCDIAKRKETILDTVQYIFKVHKVRYSRLILSPSYSYITRYKSRIRQICTATRFCKSDIIWTMCPRSFIPISKIPFSF